jgi:hypothetical protein
LEGEFGIRRRERRDECVFKRLDGAFGGVDAMIVGLDQLQLAFFFGEELFNIFCGLIIHDIHLRFIPLRF